MITQYVANYTAEDFGLPFASLKYSASLAGSTDTTLTIPSNAKRYKVIIRTKDAGIVWVALNETAAVPAGATFAATTSELVKPNTALCREVIAGDILHFITATASTEVSVVLYQTGNSSSGF